MWLRAVRHSSYDSPAKSFSLARLMRDLYKDSFGVVIDGAGFVGVASVTPRDTAPFREVTVRDTQESSFGNNDWT